jgi:hypothetical protein
MDFDSKDIGWPEDTMILNYPHIAALQQAVLQLVITQHVFVVSPKHNAIAMSQDAAREIGAF